MMKFLSRQENEIESPLKKKANPPYSELEQKADLKELIGIMEALEAQVAQRLKTKTRKGLDIVRRLLSRSGDGSGRAAAAEDKENLHPNKPPARGSGKGLGGGLLKKSSPQAMKVIDSTPSMGQKKDKVLIFTDATTVNKSNSKSARTTRSGGKKCKEKVDASSSIISSSPTSEMESGAGSETTSGSSVNTNVSDTDSVGRSTVSKSPLSSTDDNTYVDSEWEASSNARSSSGSVSGSGGSSDGPETPMSSLRWGTPSRSSTDVVDVEVAVVVETKDSVEGKQKNRGNKKKIAALLRGAPSNRESTGSTCSESSLASDAETVVLRPSDASDLSNISPASLALPAPGTPGAKLLARGTGTPLSSKKTVGGSSSKSGSKTRLLCTPKSVKKMPPLPPSPSPTKVSSTMPMRSNRKRSPVAVKGSSGTSSPSGASSTTSPASGAKRKKARESPIAPEMVARKAEPESEPEVDLHALSAAASSLLPQALALYKGVEGDSARASAKAGLLTYGPGDFVVVAALAFLLALQTDAQAGTRGDEGVMRDEAAKLACLAPYLHYASMPAGLIQSQETASVEASRPMQPQPQAQAGGRSSLRQRQAAAQVQKKTVSFCQNDGSAVSPPNDRRPASWVNSYSISQRFYALVQAMDRIAVPAVPTREAVGAFAALSYACRRFRCENEDKKESIEGAKRLLQSFFAPFLESCFGQMTESITVPRPFEVVRIFGLLHEDLSLSRPSSPADATTASATTARLQPERRRLSELRHRSSWMASAVIRYVVRWIFDEAPFNISTPSAAGPPVIPYCRSAVHHSLRLTSRSDERLIQLCHGDEGRIGGSEGQSDSHGEVGAVALPIINEVDPADMAVSSLVSCALRQIDRLMDLLLSKYPHDSVSINISSFGCTKQLADLTEQLIDDTLGEERGDEPGEDPHSATGVVQLTLAAEYARDFLQELAELSETHEDDNFSLPYADATLGSANAWTVLSTCASMLQVTGASDDRYLSLFVGGMEAFKAKLREPLLQQGTIRKCQSYFREVLQGQHEAKRVRVAARQAERERRASSRNPSSGKSSVAGSSKPVFCWDIVQKDVVFDFPLVSVAEK